MPATLAHPTSASSRPNDVPPNLVRSLTTGLVVQHALLLVDLLLTMFAELQLHTLFIVIVLYILQLLFIITNIILLYFRFAHTFAFKAGMIHVMVREFWPTFAVTGIYFVIAAAYRATGVLNAIPCNNKPCEFYKTQGFINWMVAFRVAGLGYYHVMHRALVQICDPRYYCACDWIRKRMR